MSSHQVQQIIAQMGKRAAAYRGLGGTLKFDFGEDGSVLIDGKSNPSVSDGDGKPADTTIAIALDTFEQLENGELDQTSAFMQGKLRVLGDMSLALKAEPVLRKARGRS